MGLNIPFQTISHATFPAHNQTHLCVPLHGRPVLRASGTFRPPFAVFATSSMCTYPLNLDFDIPGMNESLLVSIMDSTPARCDLNCELSIHQHKLPPKGNIVTSLYKKSQMRSHPDLAEQLCPPASLPLQPAHEMSQAFHSWYQHLHRSGGTLYLPRLLSWIKQTFSPSFHRKGMNRPFSQEKSILFCAVLQEHRPGRAPCHLMSSASISLYDYLVNF